MCRFDTLTLRLANVYRRSEEAWADQVVTDSRARLEELRRWSTHGLACMQGRNVVGDEVGDEIPHTTTTARPARPYPGALALPIVAQIRVWHRSKKEVWLAWRLFGALFHYQPILKFEQTSMLAAAQCPLQDVGEWTQKSPYERDI